MIIFVVVERFVRANVLVGCGDLNGPKGHLKAGGCLRYICKRNIIGIYHPSVKYLTCRRCGGNNMDHRLLRCLRCGCSCNSGRAVVDDHVKRRGCILLVLPNRVEGGGTGDIHRLGGDDLAVGRERPTLEGLALGDIHRVLDQRQIARNGGELVKHTATVVGVKGDRIFLILPDRIKRGVALNGVLMVANDRAVGRGGPAAEGLVDGRRKAAFGKLEDASEDLGACHHARAAVGIVRDHIGGGLFDHVDACACNGNRSLLGVMAVSVVNANGNRRALLQSKVLNGAKGDMLPFVIHLCVDGCGVALVNHLIVRISAAVNVQCQDRIGCRGIDCRVVVTVSGAKLTFSKIVISAVIQRAVYEIRLSVGIGRKYKAAIAAGAVIFGFEIQLVMGIFVDVIKR